MRLAEEARKGLGYFKRIVDYRSVATASLIQRNLPHVLVPLRPEGGRIVADEIGLSLDPGRHAYYLPLLPHALDLVREGSGSFGLDEAGDPEFRIADLRLVPENVDDLSILHEIFARRLYEMEDGRDWFVLDVGTNVGYSALYFAGVKGWEVMGYEPFPTTFSRAVHNVGRNGMADRIEVRQAGVGGRSERIEVAFNEASRSTNGLFGNLQAVRSTQDARVEIEIVDAVEVMEEAIVRARGRPVLVKLDCEGAEYDILERLAGGNLLSRVDALIVEVHFIRPEHTSARLDTLLRAEGFFLKTLWTGPEAEGVLAIRLRS